MQAMECLRRNVPSVELVENECERINQSAFKRMACVEKKGGRNMNGRTTSFREPNRIRLQRRMVALEAGGHLHKDGAGDYTRLVCR